MRPNEPGEGTLTSLTDAERYTTWFENLPAAVAVLTGPELVVEYANALFGQLVGRPVVGQPLLRALPELEGQGYIELLDRVSAGGEEHTAVPSRMLLRRGPAESLEETYLDVTFKPLRGPGGEVGGILFHGIEVTDHVDARRELETLNRRLEAAEARFRGLFESAADAILVADAEGRYLDANGEATELLGYTRDQLLGLRVSDVVARERDWTDEEYRRFMSEGRWRDEIELRRKDGTVVRAEAVATIVHLPSETIYLSTLRSVEERRRAEEARRASEERHRRLFEAMAHGIVYQDAEGRITSANPAAQRILGLTPDQMEGRTSVDPRWRALREDGTNYPGEKHPAMVALRTGEEVRNVLMGVFHPEEDGHRWILISAVPERDESGQVRGVVSTFEDVTDRKRMQDEQESLLRRERAARIALRRATHELRRIQRIIDPSMTYLPFDRFLQELLTRIKRELAVDVATLFVVTAGGDELVAQASVGLEEEEGVRIPFRDSFAGTVAASGRSMILEDASGAQLVGPEALARAASVAGVPLRADGSVIGVFRVVSWQRRRFSQEDVTLLELVAARSASAIQRARIQDERDRMGRALQESLLPPRLPKIPGVRVAARYVPASQGNQVGGDFFDVFELPAGSWAVAIGDVCGKGPSAAATMGIARHSIRAIAQGESRPSAVLSTVNDLLLREEEIASFITAAFLRLTPNASGFRATLSSGGHPLPLRRSVDGTVAPVGEPGLLLGSFPAQLSDTVVDLVPGDLLVLYTDGAVEPRNENGTDLDALRALLREGEGLGAEEVADRMERLTARNVDDDRAWVVLEVTAPGRVA